MDQRERYSDPPETTRVALEWMQGKMWTALPCVVVAFPSASGISTMMVDVQPQIAGTVLNAEGGTDVIQMPVLVDVPISFPGGGGCILTFPIKPGDECLVVFASRCLDAWWQQGPGTAEATGDIVPPPYARMHSLSDGIAFVGLRSSPRELDIDVDTAQLRSDDGDVFVSIHPTHHDVNVTSTDGNVFVTCSDGDVSVKTPSGNVKANGVVIDQNGNMTVPGNIICAGTVTGQTQVVAGVGGAAVHVTTHKHPTAATGAPSPPTPGT